MKIMVFVGSDSPDSIQMLLARYVASLFDKSKIEILDLTKVETDSLSWAMDNSPDTASQIQKLASKIDETSLCIISLPEKNDSYQEAFKKMFDALARIPNRKVLGKKPVVLVSASLGVLDGINGVEAIGLARQELERNQSEILASFSCPNFHENFKEGQMVNTAIYLELMRKVNHIKQTHFKAYYNYQSFTCGIDPERDGGCGDANEY
ncbi:MAG: NAD(P)H-dependent FMN reductase [Halieaceae bacterium]|jgi:NAD(P)H-dependent FMN reductase